MLERVPSAIRSALKGRQVYCKFLSANDTGLTGGHQEGIYIELTAWPILFDSPGIRGKNKERVVTIQWQDNCCTESCFKYYGSRSRNEYRITRFGKGFPWRKPERTGDLLVLVQQDMEHYDAWVLVTDDEINAFLDTFGLSPADTGAIIRQVSRGGHELQEQLKPADAGPGSISKQLKTQIEQEDTQSQETLEYSTLLFDAFLPQKAKEIIEKQTVLHRVQTSDTAGGKPEQVWKKAWESQIDLAIREHIAGLKEEFPSTAEMSATARLICERAFEQTGDRYIQNKLTGRRDPDLLILLWVEAEYRLFQMLEEDRYGSLVYGGFDSMESFVDLANVVLNRRKSRAGKSLEHHLSAIFETYGLIFESQVRTEGGKKPDFIFPGGAEYHNPGFPVGQLVFLGAKTTCKDRWRQIINEANRIPIKHLFTLQRGNSPQQLEEMKEERIVLVVPQPYHKAYPKPYQDMILKLGDFIELVRTTA